MSVRVCVCAFVCAGLYLGSGRKNSGVGLIPLNGWLGFVKDLLQEEEVEEGDEGGWPLRTNTKIG